MKHFRSNYHNNLNYFVLGRSKRKACTFGEKGADAIPSFWLVTVRLRTVSVTASLGLCKASEDFSGAQQLAIRITYSSKIHVLPFDIQTGH